MKANLTMWRLLFTFGLLAASHDSVARSADLNAGDVIENSIKMSLAYIPPGEFDMGSPSKEKQRSVSEKMHHVKLTKGFYMGVHEVTQAQFLEVMRGNPSRHTKGGEGENTVSGQDTDSFPVENVSWFDAIAFCNELSNREELPEYYTLEEVKGQGAWIKSAKVTENDNTGYRLPTEAEWEYACRAGTKTPFYFGDKMNSEQANVNGKYPYKAKKGPYLERTCTVGSYPANAFGLHDMHGNVLEWCNDWHGNYGGDEIDPKGPDSGSFRVVRGGAYWSEAWQARSASRSNGVPAPSRVTDFGFRVVRTP